MKSVTLYECPKCGDVSTSQLWCLCGESHIPVKYVPAAEVEALEGQIESNAAIMAENDNMLADFSEREVLWKEYTALLGAENRRLMSLAMVRGWTGKRDVYRRGLELRRKLGIEEG